MDCAFEKTIAALGPFASLSQIRRGRRPALWAFAIWSDREDLNPELFELLDRDFQELQRLADPAFVKPLELHLAPLPCDLHDPHPRTVPFLLYPEVRFRRTLDEIPERPWTDAQIVAIFRELAGLIGALHADGLTGDPNPELLFLNYQGGGLRWLRLPWRWLQKSDELTDPGRDIVIPPKSIRTLSPERVRGSRSTPPSDLFTLASMLYEALTGTPAFQGEGMIAGLARIVRGELPPLDGPRIGPRLKELLVACWSLEPAKRPSAGEFAKALEEALQQR